MCCKRGIATETMLHVIWEYEKPQEIWESRGWVEVPDVWKLHDFKDFVAHGHFVWQYS